MTCGTLSKLLCLARSCVDKLSVGHVYPHGKPPFADDRNSSACGTSQRKDLQHEDRIAEIGSLREYQMIEHQKKSANTTSCSAICLCCEKERRFACLCWRAATCVGGQLEMKRREFITFLGGGAAVAWPRAARAQQPERVRRIGVLMASAADDWESHARIAAFLQGLRDGERVGDASSRSDHRARCPAPSPAVYSYRYMVAAGGLISYGPDSSTSTAAQPVMSTASSRARSRPTCRCRRRPNTSWCSTSRPPRRSASTYLRPCSHALMR